MASFSNSPFSGGNLPQYILHAPKNKANVEVSSMGAALKGAADSSRVAVVEQLLDAGVDPKTKDLLFDGYLAAVALVLDFGAHINTIDSSGGYTALSAAARRGHEEMARLLLDREAQLYEQSGARRSPDRSSSSVRGCCCSAASPTWTGDLPTARPASHSGRRVWMPVAICLPSIATR